ncbi:MAG: hypothetical protein IPN32_35670 [Deltaproteobacteria bacterium]|nr:hypothetical protein [Deltaproteobacteria bacterium]
MNRNVTLLAVVLAACTADNPFLPDDTSGGEAGSSSGTASTTATSTTATSTTASSTTASSTTTDDSSTSATTDAPTTSADSSSSGPPICFDTCRPLAPAGWTGPVAMIVDTPSDPDPACVDVFDTMSRVAFDDVTADAVTCGCTCGNPVGASCATPTIRRYGQAGCPGGQLDGTYAVAGCNINVNSPANQYWTGNAPVTGGNCTPTPSVDKPTPSFTRRETACGIAVPDNLGCNDDEVCLAPPLPPYDGRVCIWAEGDVECPADLPYQDRSVLHDDVDDQRDCSTCSCATPEGDCTGNVYLFGTNDCSENPVSSVSLIGSCNQASNLGVSSALTSAGTPPQLPVGLSCDPSEPNPIGEILDVSPTTYCCLDG